MPDPVTLPGEQERVSLVELVNRVVDRGVSLSGEVTISVADVDLLFVGLRVLLCSIDRVDGSDASRPGELGGGPGRRSIGAGETSP